LIPGAYRQERMDSMKLYFTAFLATIAFAGLLMTSGCGPTKAELLAMNRSANEERNKALAEAMQLQEENDRLQQMLAQKDAALSAKQQEIDLLERAKNELQRALDELQGKFGREIPSPGPMIALPAALDAELRKLVEQYPDLFEYLPQYGMVKIKADLTFEKGSDAVSSQAKEALARFAEIVNSQAGSKFNVYVAGHTDDIPVLKPETRRTHPNNWYLSVHRSVSVQQELVRSGLAPQRIGVLGFSEYHPVEMNAPGNKGNPANRRVELWLVPPDRFLTAGSTAGGVAAAAPAVPTEK